MLDGNGVMHMNDDADAAARRAAASIFQRVSCTPSKTAVPGVMRVLGVFRPAGSPAAAFYPDGTPAYTTDEPQTASAAP